MWSPGDGGNARGPAPNAIMPLEKTAPVAATVVHGPDGYEKLARWVEQLPGFHHAANHIDRQAKGARLPASGPDYAHLCLPLQ